MKEKRSHGNTLIYDVWNEIFMGAKPLRIWFEKLDGFIKLCNGTIYLVLFGPERYGAVYNRIWCLIKNVKQGK